jgi:WD40 repeat protein
VRSPRWGGGRFDTRIAYLRGDELRVVAGDGTGDHRLARHVRPVAPAWQPATFHFVAYVAPDGRVVSADADSGRTLWSTRVPDVTRLEWSGGDPLLLVQGQRSLTVLGPGGRVRYRLLGGAAAAPVVTARFSPSGRSLAFIQRTAGRSYLWVVPRLAPDASAARRVFSGVGSFTDLEWSPDGRWLLVGWRDADQWVFIPSARVRRIEAVSKIRSQFDSTRFPRVSGWCCG